GPSRDADNPHTVLPVSLAKLSGSPDYSGCGGQIAQKPAENKAFGPATPSDTTRTVTASAGDTTRTHIETISIGSPRAGSPLRSGLPSTSKTSPYDSGKIGGLATSKDEMVETGRTVAGGKNR